MRNSVAGLSSVKEMVVEEMCEVMEARGLADGAADFADVWEAVEGRAERAVLLPGMLVRRGRSERRRAQQQKLGGSHRTPGSRALR